MSDRNQVNYNRIVGIKDDQIYLVNYTFEDTLNGSEFKGVTGAVLSPVSQAYIDDRNSEENLEEYYREFWSLAVQEGDTELGLTDWIEQNVDRAYEDGDFPGHDTSYVNHLDLDSDVIKENFPDAVTFECIGGGRCFTKNMEFDVIIDEFLVSEINRLEK